ncbi:MAG: TetR/AcrR family transcriptional regulator [Clostridia bacterium]|nr:TetR/AcrR family transcriptional regulator [Clostridia bacterium]MBN2883486.1 TetR/AcrR family transcriptional regulator [Clostridia bacterium]
MTTKEKIADEALTLFSINGYNGVTVKEISAAVGIKDSSLYKHYTSKKEIFETIIGLMEARLDEMHSLLNVPDARTMNVSEHFSNITDTTLTDMVERMFLFYLKDHIVGRIRRLFTVEQYRNSEIAQRYGSMFIDSALDYHEEVFRQMIASGSFIEGDLKQMALEFYSPIFLLLCKVDNKPETEQTAIEMLKKHVLEFGARYSTRKENEVI